MAQAGGNAMKRKVQLAKLRTSASFEPSTLDAEARTVELCWYSGAFVHRYNWEHGTYLLGFSMEPKAIRLDRMKSGAPVLNAHNDWSLGDVIGVVEKARVEKGKGYATVRFSEREEVAPIFGDVKAGILRNVSMGAIVHQMKEVTEKGDPVKKFLAIDWEPLEVSLVPIGADPGAQALAQTERFPCVVQFSGAVAPKEDSMKVRLLADVEDVGKLGDIVEIEELEFDDELHSKDLEEKAPRRTEALDERSEDRLLSDEIEADKRRAERIRAIQMHHDLDDFWAERCIRKGFTVKQALTEARKRRSDSTPELDGRIRHGEDYDSMGWSVARMTEALAARAERKACPEPAHAYARHTFAECGYVILEKLGKTRGRALDPLRGAEEVIKLALSTSDFSGLLANTLNKNLLEKYMLATPTFRRIAKEKQFKDYRPHTFHRAGDFPLPLQVGENGEIQQGSMGESKETVTALRYGRILPLSLEILVNDDLNAFTDFGDLVARRIMDFESATFYSRCISTGSGLGPTLTDGVVLYNSTHANVNTTGALDNTRLEEAWGLMASQTTVDGLKQTASPKFVLTSATSYVLARRLLSPIFAAQASNVNAFDGILEAIYDPNLSGTRYYVLSDPADGTNYVYGTINGQGPRFAVREGWEVEGVEVKVAHDFGCGAIDYRFGVTGNGTP
jgi:hypothetical protein